MIIVKPKTALFVGQKKSGEFQTFETCPEKGLIFKARTMTNSEVAEYYMTLADKEISKSEKIEKICTLGKTVITEIVKNPKTYTLESLGFDFYSGALNQILIDSILTEDDEIFLD